MKSRRENAIQAAELLYQARGILEDKRLVRGATHCWCVRLANQAEITARTILGDLGIDSGLTAMDADQLKLKVMSEPEDYWFEDEP